MKREGYAEAADEHENVLQTKRKVVLAVIAVSVHVSHARNRRAVLAVISVLYGDVAKHRARSWSSGWRLFLLRH